MRHQLYSFKRLSNAERIRSADETIYQVFAGHVSLGVVVRRRHRGVGGIGRYRHQSWAHTCWGQGTMPATAAGCHRTRYEAAQARAGS